MRVATRGGGIYRHVWLVKRAQTHLVTWGTFVAPHVHAASIAGDASTGPLRAVATLNITAQVTSQSTEASVSATFELIDLAGATVATLSSSDAPVVAGGQVTLRAMGGVPAVELWTLRNPNLYTVRTRLLSTSSKAVLDEENTTVGFRALRYSKVTSAIYIPTLE